MSTAELVIGYLCAGVIFFMLVWVGVALHMGYTKIDVMLDHLKNCTAVMARAPLRDVGPWGRLLLVGGISGIVTFPGFYLRNGQLNPGDLEHFPASLKRKVVALQWSVWGLLITLFLLVVAGKSGVFG